MNELTKIAIEILKNEFSKNESVVSTTKALINAWETMFNTHIFRWCAHWRH